MQRKYIFPLFLLFQILVLKVISFFPELVERFYSNGLYIVISKISRTLFGKIPFSVGDLIYGFLIVYLLFRLWKTKKSWRLNWKENSLTIISYFSVAYFVFHLLWGFNYYRVPLFEKMNIQREYSDEDLYNFTEKLIVKSNEIQFEITKNKNLKVCIPYSQDSIFKMTQNGYANLAKQYPFFEYKIESRKKSLFSLPLTYMGFGGYINPFTNEAQVNYKTPIVGLPMTINHEMAHQLGFASESECNFIGFLACIKNDDLYFKYSAYSNALRYCMDNIGMKNEENFNYFKSKINPGIIENYKENDAFWNSYDTFIDKGFHAFYDYFLKINQQKDGIESYSKYVDLLVNYYKIKTILD
jgi:hypothetical protein